ncbi:alpha/beta fold hydrolase [Gluconacetobacter diazotrophicus]|uniref:Alpha/beta fold hydrolase n=1 Tax=Gluconacetobacter diazotrophicus TaxID=33996 RepID=A0A7W4FFD6_GLUDI|nr:alpha/beta hydrolase [Gluconacetobacter diazotrophicus]MBB2156494.1 alpha/beta fold hydrolase [Gluconacetobacter diazotrophicus]
MALPPEPAFRPGLLFVHGWGFTPDFWQPVQDRLGRQDAVRLDFGFFGPACMEARPARPYVAVGHSLGALWLLLHRPAACLGMVLINGFARFGAAADYRQGVPARVIDRMVQGLDHNADGVVATFRDRAGIGTPPPGAADPDRLARALAILRDADARPLLASPDALPPVAVLAGRVDPIVSPAMTDACFHDRLAVDWIADGGHLLPLTHPDACAAAITHMMDAAP